MSKTKIPSFWWRMVVVLLFIAVAAGAMTKGHTPGKSFQTSFKKGRAFSSPFGKRTRVTLPDKTEVILNSNTTLWLDENFGKLNREVAISGDALFKVSRAAQPFVIHTPHLILTTSSTIAKVNGYADQPGEETLMFSGKMKAMKSYYSKLDHEPYFLKDGDMVMMNKDIDLMEKETFDKNEWKMWLEDKIALNNVALNEFVSGLKNWFNTGIEVQGKPPAALRYTGTFSASDLQAILNTVGKAWKFRYQARGNTVILEF